VISEKFLNRERQKGAPEGTGEDFYSAPMYGLFFYGSFKMSPSHLFHESACLGAGVRLSAHRGDFSEFCEAKLNEGDFG